MTISELEELMTRAKDRSKQIIFTLGSKKFRVKEVLYTHGSSEPVEFRLEEFRD